MGLRISIFDWKSWFFLWFLEKFPAEKECSVNSYRKPYCKCYHSNFIKTVTFSLKRTLSVDVRTSYSTSSQYYFPLTVRRIWSPYDEGKCSFGWDKGLKIMSKTMHFERKQQLWLHFMTFWLFWAWFWGLCLNQNHTFPCRMDFIFYELLEENSTASSWNMKSVRQQKVLIWEKTLWKKWNPVCTIYCRGSYSNSQDRAFGANAISRITRKIENFIRKSRMWGILISKRRKKSCFPRSNWLY